MSPRTNCFKILEKRYDRIWLMNCLTIPTRISPYYSCASGSQHINFGGDKLINGNIFDKFNRYIHLLEVESTDKNFVKKFLS